MSDPPVVLVTGASRGLGEAITIELASAGATRVLAVRDPAAATRVQQAAQERGGECMVQACDVASYEAVEQTVRSAIDKFDRIDAVINNAALVDPVQRIGDGAPHVWAYTIAVNLVGPYNTARAVLPAMLARGTGAIVNISTGAAETAREGWSAYCSSKAGLAMFSRVMHEEYRTRGISVYSFRPGLIDTPMHDKIRASGLNEISRLSKEKLMPPVRSARVAAWLALAAPADLVLKELSIHMPGLFERADDELRRR